MTAALSVADGERLETLLPVQERRSALTRIKEPPAPLKHLRQWTERLQWLASLCSPRPFLAGVAPTKMQQFAAEAAALEVGDMRDIVHKPRCSSLLLCWL